jgi:auxin efflux carrier family protein
MKSFLGTLDDIMTPPLYAGITSLIVTLIPPIQTFLKDHMKPLTRALKNAGECSIPITLVVLGGYFYTPPDDEESFYFYFPNYLST